MNNTRKNKDMLRYLLPIIIALLGAVCGYCYYRFVGCSNGTCFIKSNLYLSTVYGAVLGALLGYVISPQKSKKDEKSS